MSPRYAVLDVVLELVESGSEVRVSVQCCVAHALAGACFKPSQVGGEAGNGWLTDVQGCTLNI